MGLIFDVKRYAIHDGPGIRTTVFLKGCPLHCRWCHNPEGILSDPEFMWWHTRCLGCHDCLNACPTQAISFQEGVMHLDHVTCDQCHNCVEACPSRALELVGEEMTTSEVMHEIRKDLPFYAESGGGVTFSGGEPLMQPDFLLDLLKACSDEGIHTAVDTCGFAPFEELSRISGFVDLFLYDMKFIDNEKHMRYTGVSNELILENLTQLAQQHPNVVVRVPLIPGINDSDHDIRALEAYLLSLGSIQGVSILPYHKAGVAKAKRLLRGDIVFFESKLPKPEQIEFLVQTLEKQGFAVTVGG